MKTFQELIQELGRAIRLAESALTTIEIVGKQLHELDRAYTGDKSELSIGAVVKLDGEWKAYMLERPKSYGLSSLTVRTFEDCVYQVTGFIESEDGGKALVQLSALAGYQGGAGYVPIPAEFIKIIRA